MAKVMAALSDPSPEFAVVETVKVEEKVGVMVWVGEVKPEEVKVRV